MKITYLQTSPYDFNGGCWFYRFLMPAEALRKRGHLVKFLVASPDISDEFLKFPDVVVLRGTYPFDPIGIMREFKKRDTRVVYDIDDDYLTVNPVNPVFPKMGKVKDQFVNLIREADVVTVTNNILKSRVERYNKNVAIVPNALNFNKFKYRPLHRGQLTIGYTGASSHWEDINLVIDVLADLQKKYNFKFYIQGMCGTPLIGEIYRYKYIERDELEPERRDYYRSAIQAYNKLKKMKFIHIPFYPPELYPAILSALDLDIGIAPLKDNAFNQAKSPIKFYEYVATGTPVLASNVLPYKGEVNYLANNNYKDWYKKLEKLIVNKKFREKLYNKQRALVMKTANIDNVVKLWEKVFSD